MYQRFCRKAAAGGVCGACGVSGLQNGGQYIPLRELKFFILRSDEHSTSLFAKFTREKEAAQSKRDRAIAQFKIDCLHTCEHNGQLYHLFNEGIVNKNGCVCCRTCSTCNASLRKFIEKLSADDEVVRLSKNVDKRTVLSDGSVVYPPPCNTFSDWDFGRLIMEYVDHNGVRRPLRCLSPVERQALCMLVVGADIHEVQDAKDVNFACRLKGQTIVMPCNVAEMLHEYSAETLPRKDLAKWVKILFQGKRQCYSAKIAADLNSGRACMEYEEVRRHLLRLQQLGVYKDIVTIASKADCHWDENKVAIQQNIATINDRRVTVAQAARSSDTAKQWDTDCSTEQAPGAPSQADFGVVMSTSAMFTRGNSDKNLAVAFVAMAAGNKRPADVRDEDADSSSTRTLKSVIENDPINEFTHMPRILSGAFPHEFPFGVSSSDLGGPASLKKRVLRRLTRLYDGRVSHNYHLLVYLGNMLLRHASCAATSARAELDCSAKLVSMVNQPDWQDRASKIATDPEGDEAKELVKQISPWVRLAGRKVPWSPLERLSASYHLYSLYHHFGAPSYFITFAPKTLTNQLMLRFGMFQDGKRGSHADLKLPEHLQRRVKLLTSNTIAQARAYELIVQGVCTILFGIKPESKCKKTHPPVPGLFGTATAYYGVTECQSRNALHAHFNLWVRTMHPEIIQRFAHDTELRQRLVNCVDAVVTATTENYEICALSSRPPVKCTFERKPYGFRFEATPSGKSVRIVGTTSDSVAAKLGVRRGMDIESIGEVDVRGMSSEFVRDMIRDLTGSVTMIFGRQPLFDSETGKRISSQRPIVTSFDKDNEFTDSPTDTSQCSSVDYHKVHIYINIVV